MDTFEKLSTVLRETRHLLTIRPTTVSADDSLDRLVVVGIKNPGARVVSVVDADGKLVGVISLAALIEPLLVQIGGLAALTSTPNIVRSKKLVRLLRAHHAGDIMQRPVSVHPSASIKEALGMMLVRGLPGLPITDEQERVVGYADQLELLATQRSSSEV